MALDDEERQRRATSFADVADAYERFRPGYPDDAVCWLVGSEPLDVVDLGAGTGKLTRSLVALGHRVTAVEPLPEMISHLHDIVPGVTAVKGGAEAVPLEDESADVVVAAQAFHWFDHGPALREIARVLRPGGHVALVWNTRDEREPWVAQLSKEALTSEGFEERDAAAPVRESGLFGEVELVGFPLSQRLDREGLVGLVLSRSYCAVLGPAERAPVLDRVGTIFEEHQIDGMIELPYVTQCFRAPRL